MPLNWQAHITWVSPNIDDISESETCRTDVGTRNMMLITDISARRQDLVHGSLCSLP